MIRWDECHTDIPPQKPLLQLAGAAAGDLIDGGTVPDGLRHRLTEGGVRVSRAATLSRGGVRDFKWLLIDPETKQTYVLRNGQDRLDVYGSAVTWKNPVRFLPEPIEVALALGSPSALNLLRACSSRAEEYVTVANNSWSVADAMAAVSGARFVLDSSKSPLRSKLMYMMQPQRVHILHLVRDGRAVSASAMRRRNMSATMAARIWKRDNQNLGLMLRSVPNRLKLRVSYEALCEAPAVELRRVCDFLGLDFDPPAMLTLCERPVHNIPGNPMLFNRSRRTISKDERWRRELSERDLQAFDRTAGRLNRSFGYR